MDKSIFTIDDLIAQAGISELVLKEWEMQKLFKPIAPFRLLDHSHHTCYFAEQNSI